MKGFIAGIIIIVLVLGLVVFSAVFAEARLDELYDDVTECEVRADYEAVRSRIDGLYPFLCAVSPDDLLREVEDSLGVCIAEDDGAEIEKSRLLFALSELRRQVGISPISIL